ncbi:hypothetical protein D9M68_186260 [compost metagenome]
MSFSLASPSSAAVSETLTELPAVRLAAVNVLLSNLILASGRTVTMTPSSGPTSAVEAETVASAVAEICTAPEAVMVAPLRSMIASGVAK